MTDKMKALRDLLAKVDVGTWPGDIYDYVNGHENHMFAYKAFNGSLDAAKALHDAVLPGWIYLIGSQIAGVSMSDHEDPRWWNMVHNGNPARAWLICILRALIAQADL